MAIGWVADTAGLNLATAGVETDPRGFVRVDAHLRTSAAHVFAAGDITGVDLTEAQAREAHDVVVAVVRFDETTRTIIDGRSAGFCKLIADRATAAILGCHVVGERAVEIVQVVAVAIAAGLRIDDLARIPLSFPTYAGIVGRVAYRAAGQLHREPGWRGHHVEP